MGDLLPGITPAGGAVGLFIAVVLGVLGAMLRRYDKGSTDVVAGYSGLTAVLVTARENAERREAEAVRALDWERHRRIRREEYAYGLEEDLRIEHRRWDDEVQPA